MELSGLTVRPVAFHPQPANVGKNSDRVSAEMLPDGWTQMVTPDSRVPTEGLAPLSHASGSAMPRRAAHSRAA
jgi:hypothetical protein